MGNKQPLSGDIGIRLLSILIVYMCEALFIDFLGVSDFPGNHYLLATVAPF